MTWSWALYCSIPPSPRLMTRGKWLSQTMRSLNKSANVGPCQGQTCNISMELGSATTSAGLSMNNIYMLVKFSASASFVASRNCFKILLTSVDLTITTSYGWLKSIFSEMILATLAGIRATDRNVNRQCSCLNLRIRGWELHHKNRLVALFTKIKVRRLKSLILKGKWRVLCEVDGFSKYFGHVWGLISDLEAETLPESKSFNAASAHICFGSWFCWKYWFLSRGRVEFWRFVAEILSDISSPPVS